MYQLNDPARSALSEINELTDRLKSGALDPAEMDRLHEELRSAVHRFRAARSSHALREERPNSSEAPT